MCRSMVDIQSATAEIRRGKKKKKKQDKNIMSASARHQGGHKKQETTVEMQLCTGRLIVQKRIGNDGETVGVSLIPWCSAYSVVGNRQTVRT